MTFGREGDDVLPFTFLEIPLLSLGIFPYSLSKGGLGYKKLNSAQVIVSS